MPLTSIIDVARGMRRRLAGKPRQGVELSVPFVHLGTEYGGYGVALERLAPGALVYSFGLGEDISFDLALMQRLDCQVFGFDPTPRSIAWVRAQNPPAALQVRELGVADYDGVASFAPPKKPERPAIASSMPSPVGVRSRSCSASELEPRPVSQVAPIGACNRAGQAAQQGESHDRDADRRHQPQRGGAGQLSFDHPREAARDAG